MKMDSTNFFSEGKKSQVLIPNDMQGYLQHIAFCAP